MAFAGLVPERRKGPLQDDYPSSGELLSTGWARQVRMPFLSPAVRPGSYRRPPGSRIVRSRPTSAIRRSASRSAATAGGTPSAWALAKISRVVSKIFAALALARSKTKPWAR